MEAFISGNQVSPKSAALTALKADVPSQQQVRLGLQLSQLLYLHLHQDHPCSNAQGPPVQIKGAGRTRSLRLQMLSPLMVFLHERHLSISNPPSQTTPKTDPAAVTFGFQIQTTRHEDSHLGCPLPSPHLCWFQTQHALGTWDGGHGRGTSPAHTCRGDSARQGEATCERLGVTSTLSLLPKTSMLKLIYPCLSSTAFL